MLDAPRMALRSPAARPHLRVRRERQPRTGTRGVSSVSETHVERRRRPCPDRSANSSAYTSPAPRAVTTRVLTTRSPKRSIPSRTQLPKRPISPRTRRPNSSQPPTSKPQVGPDRRPRPYRSERRCRREPGAGPTSLPQGGSWPWIQSATLTAAQRPIRGCSPVQALTRFRSRPRRACSRRPASSSGG